MSATVLVSPDFPPARGGVSDHTYRFAEAWGEDGGFTVLTTKRETADAPFRVRAEIETWHAPAPLAEAIGRCGKPGWVIWQHVPQMYGRGGVNFAVSRAARALSRAGWRQAVIAHEIAAPLSWRPNRLFYGWAHRFQWRRHLALADVVGISTEAWLLRERRRWPESAGKMSLLPSPSTIPVAKVPSDAKRRWLRDRDLSEDSLLLGFFGEANWAKRMDWALAAWRAAQEARPPVAFVMVGAVQGEWSMSADERARARLLGYCSAEDASRALQCVDVLALPYVDGVAERRTSFMAGLSHGCAVATTIGRSTGPSLREGNAWAMASADDFREWKETARALFLDPARRERLKAAGVEAYRRRYDWPVVLGALREAMRRVERAIGKD